MDWVQIYSLNLLILPVYDPNRHPIFAEILFSTPRIHPSDLFHWIATQPQQNSLVAHNNGSLLQHQEVSRGKICKDLNGKKIGVATKRI